MKTSITQIWMVCHMLPFAKVGQHSVAHCVLRCGDTVIHTVFTQFHSVKMGQIHTVVICECNNVNTVWSTGCTTLCVHTVIDSVCFFFPAGLVGWARSP